MPSPIYARTEDMKRRAAEAAVAEVQHGMLVGLGTGSTAEFAIRALALRAGSGLEVTAVATSCRTADLARSLGLPVVDMASVDRLDLAIDGVDEIDDSLRAIKGRGGAMLQEKIVASAADRMIAIADESKRVSQLGIAPIPFEVLALAERTVARAVRDLGGEPVTRMLDGARYTTDQRNPVIDCRFPVPLPLPELAASLSAIPGVLGHGLFLTEIDAAYVADEHAVRRMDRA